jgi:hypothetical protein
LIDDVNGRDEFEKLLTHLKRLGVVKAKGWGVAIAAVKFMNNNADLNKTLNTAFNRELLKAARAEAVKMGATKEQLMPFDAAIKVQDDLLKSYEKEEGEHVES